MVRENNTGKIILFLLPMMVLYILFFLFPLLYNLSLSYQEWNGITKPSFVGWENYKNLLKDEIFLKSVKNNLLWALVNGFIQVPLAAGVAFILARQPRFWKSLRVIYFLPKVISGVAIAMMWRAIYNPSYGVLNAFLGIFGNEPVNWLGQIGTALPAVMFQEVVYIGYFMIIILASVMSIPVSLYEAAQIDGANVFQQEMNITIPMVKTTLITAITLAMAYGMRHFEATFLMTNGGPAHSTTVMGLLLYNKMAAFNYGEATATGTILIIMGTLVIIVMRRLFRDNDNASVSQ
ncbi:MAG: sugar ABC transporter permease [Spirochaetales bacterium]|nr:sugar ABC transporter permease [Spirochaetales bacterium]